MKYACQLSLKLSIQANIREDGGVREFEFDDVQLQLLAYPVVNTGVLTWRIPFLPVVETVQVVFPPADIFLSLSTLLNLKPHFVISVFRFRRHRTELTEEQN